ncbi:hypothetical protein DL770_007366 [Monosporascus sp. CRB-9-2]|nr:hypothetical protein DL770_007366 [Monosporascus sp. CRB-9-2]
MIRDKDLKAGRMGSNGAPSIYSGVFCVELQMALENAGGGDDEKLIDRPELPSFGLSMVENSLSPSSLTAPKEFPWATLGRATIVDVGGRADLNSIVQDRAPVLKQAEAEIWPQQSPEALKAGRVRFQQHDPFEPNRAEGADVYWFRRTLHDWSDELCVRALAAIKPAMGPRSRILICDYVMNTTRGWEEVPPAPAPLQANWGYYTRLSYPLDLSVMIALTGSPDTDDYVALHSKLVTNSEDLKFLVEGPNRTMRIFLRFGHDLPALEVAFEFNFFRLIPADGDINVAQLALKARLDKGLSVSLNEMFKASTESASCIKAPPHLVGPLMSREASWDKLRGSVLDVGDGNGHVSVVLARDNSPHMLAEGARAADLGPAKGRVRFMQHDFFESQPVRDASAVIGRQVTHNWTDDELVKIFKGVVPTLRSSKTGIPLLINDIVLLGPGRRRCTSNECS